MILYFAGASSAPFLHGDDILESFWYKRDAVEAMEHARSFFLDSGAFTAFTKGVTIKPDDYADFIHTHSTKITIASSLDAIGDAEQSYLNFLEMKRLGCEVIPVFHCREDYKWLTRYLDEGAEYIALGGMVPETKPWLKVWLDTLWGEYLTNPDGSARVKVHGFGMTIMDFMTRYPWYSCDSSSWTYGARFSAILVMGEAGRPSWIYVGEQHGSAKNLGGRNYRTFSAPDQKQIDTFVASIGVGSIEGMQADTALINEHNAKVFKQWNERLSQSPIQFTRCEQTLF